MTNSPWPDEISRLTAVVVPAAVVGMLTGYLAVSLLVGITGFAGWHIYQQHRLYTWLSTSRSANPPEGTGLWGAIYDQVFHMQRRNRRRKKRLGAILHEFRQSTAAMPDGTVVLAPDNRIVWFNAAAQRLLHLQSPDDMGQHVLNLIRSPALKAYFDTGSFQEAVEMTSPFDDATRLSMQVIPYGRDQRLLIARDITRLHRLEQVRRDFVANASHELRTPLTVISGYLESMRDDDGAAAREWRKPVQEMHNQAGRMRQILEDLLTLSRLDAQPDPGAEERVDVAALVRGICRDGRMTATNRITVDCDSDERIGLRGVHSELRSAFGNLVQNAVKYSTAGGEVHVRWYRDGDTACLDVVDSGIGIPQKHIPRLTERFYRVDDGRSRDRGGTGLGLSIVRHALQRHDASLEIHSRPGEGSTFRCRFPAERIIAMAHASATGS
ncbi:phosphate regulon sensor histidine kinase PhoR [Aquisalimonas asiatica]|uniref:Phosphate regulon sensor protein PhoR n=1 Tax=Aquisalimonas asiatica TaxID=406100 RepID=A0A1H8RTM3_9GAMM|nr:phosphate regulon sensor histidine kinase PhoR [Aquisalimonas asiatica]SEO69534.1 two-component system, OmpR family, phosphate regulon sensor histidine kinase PhoR [Aquisalimonas asiatica]